MIELLKHFAPGDVTATLKKLEKSYKAQVAERYGLRFWSAVPARYPDETYSHAIAPEKPIHR